MLTWDSSVCSSSPKSNAADLGSLKSECYANAPPASSGGTQPSFLASPPAGFAGGSAGASSYLAAWSPTIPANDGDTKSTAPPVSLALWIRAASFLAPSTSFSPKA